MHDSPDRTQDFSSMANEDQLAEMVASFKRQWRSSGSSQIAEFLGSVGGTLRSRLLIELVEAE